MYYWGVSNAGKNSKSKSPRHYTSIQFHGVVAQWKDPIQRFEFLLTQAMNTLVRYIVGSLFNTSLVIKLKTMLCLGSLDSSWTDQFNKSKYIIFKNFNPIGGIANYQRFLFTINIGQYTRTVRTRMY